MAAPSDELSKLAALADQIYVRSEDDQSFSLGDIDTSLSAVTLPANAIIPAEAGLTLTGDYFYSDRGFVGRIVTDGTNYTVVFRGTDAAVVDTVQNVLSVLGQNDPTKVDGEDIQTNIDLGSGTNELSQADDAIALTQAAIALAGDASKVTVVGQSLGGGLAGLVSGVLGVQAVAFAPAPFGNQLERLAENAAAEDQGISFEHIDDVFGRNGSGACYQQKTSMDPQ